MQSLLNQFKRTLNQFSLMWIIDLNWFLNQFSWNLVSKGQSDSPKSITLILIWTKTLCAALGREQNCSTKDSFSSSLFKQFDKTNIFFLLESITSLAYIPLCYLNTPGTILVPTSANSKGLISTLSAGRSSLHHYQYYSTPTANENTADSY